MEKGKMVERITRDASSALEVITQEGKYEFGQPDERGIRLVVKDGKRNRFRDDFCKIEEDISIGQPLILRLASTNRFFPGYCVRKGEVKQIRILEISREEFQEYAVNCTEESGKGWERDWIRAGGPRCPEYFEEYRRVFLESYASTVQQWFMGAECYSGDDDRWGICDHLMRVVLALLKYFPSDGTDYIEGKFSLALGDLGYKLVRSWGDERYRRILPSLPIKTSGRLDPPLDWAGVQSIIKIRSLDHWLTKKELKTFYLAPLVEALEVSRKHCWDEPALLIVKSIVLLMADDLQTNFDKYSSEIEDNLWQVAFLLGYRLVKKVEARQKVEKVLVS